MLLASPCPQWFVLTRRHAELILADWRIERVFRKHCKTTFEADRNSERVCYSGARAGRLGKLLWGCCREGLLQGGDELSASLLLQAATKLISPLGIKNKRLPTPLLYDTRHATDLPPPPPPHARMPASTCPPTLPPAPQTSTTSPRFWPPTD